MTESELLMLMIEIQSNQQNIIAAWFSITFGLYTLAYVVGENLRRGSVLFVVLAYGLLTSLAFSLISGYLEMVSDILSDLNALQENGAQLTATSIRQIQAFDDVSFIVFIQLSGYPILAAGAVGYLVFQHYKGRRKENSNGTK